MFSLLKPTSYLVLTTQMDSKKSSCADYNHGFDKVKEGEKYEITHDEMDSFAN